MQNVFKSLFGGGSRARAHVLTGSQTKHKHNHPLRGRTASVVHPSACLQEMDENAETFGQRGGAAVRCSGQDPAPGPLQQLRCSEPQRLCFQKHGLC